MAASDYTPSGTFPDLDGTSTGPLQLPADGDVYTYDVHYDSASPKHGLFGKLIDACDYLKKNAGASAVALYTGTMWTIAAGNLSTFLHLLADKAAKLDGATNAFTGAVTVGTTLSVTGATSLSSTLNVSGVTTLSNVGATLGTFATTRHTSYASKTPTAVSNSVTTYTHTATGGAAILTLDGWHDAGHTLTLTLADHVGADYPEVEIWWNPTNAGGNDTIAVQRSGAVDVVGIITAGYARCRWNGTVWKCLYAMPFDFDAAHITIVP